jgi:hypothetical protein
MWWLDSKTVVVFHWPMVLLLSFIYIFINHKWFLLETTPFSNLKLTTCSSKLLLIIEIKFEMFLLVCLVRWMMHAFCKFQACMIKLWMVICSKWFKVKKKLNLTSWVTKVIHYYHGYKWSLTNKLVMCVTLY